MEKIKIAILGYGNLGKSVEKVAKNTSDIEVIAIFSRRNPSDIKSAYAPVYHIDDILNFKDKIDVVVLCGGSANDLEIQTPQIAAIFNTVDSFDTHKKIPEYFKKVNLVAKDASTLSMISSGWDPGLFSLARIIFDSVLPKGQTHTFWGKGVSQGHSDAIRRVLGVKDAKQYTIPKEEIINSIKNGEKIEITAQNSHLRECFVVLDGSRPKEEVENEIKNMPNYFAGYETIVNFISQEELDKNHKNLPHGGKVLRIGKSSEDTSHVLEFSLNLDSNPDFTASVNVACARAVYRLAKEGNKGAISIFDIAPKYYSEEKYEDLLAKKL